VTSPRVRRCAIYTRKSSEEGLEQDFNSLQAQREACEAYIRSQRHEGWRLIETAYDDGGISGATMERPGLQRLLGDIGGNRVDTIVVYKVDRLTRSLADFAKMVELFDAHSVSFVAVTQQFNTTTSMGRLTLNVLLSFAQFEREVTGERIRDKIAASKKKGMWMGGNVPLGYDVRDRKLIINPNEAERVRLIFRRHAELGSVRRLKEALDHENIASKLRLKSDGKTSGGGRFSRGALYALLKNPIYIGEIPHKGVSHPGQHQPILDRRLWDRVQKRLEESGSAPRPRRNQDEPSPLAGKLFDERGERLVPSHTSKDGRRYRYYVSRHLVTGTGKHQKGWRLPASEVEQAAKIAAAQMLLDRDALVTILRNAQVPAIRLPAALAAAASVREKLLSATDSGSALAALVERVEVQHDGLSVTLALQPLLPERRQERSDAVRPIIRQRIPLQMRHRGQEIRLVIEGAAGSPANHDPALLKVVARALQWFQDLASGQAESLVDIAGRETVSDRYVGQLLSLAFLAPEIIEAISSGRQPPHLTAKTLIASAARLPLDWSRQESVLR
jgi:DNA invertase Pin-like site-specific DNA recombinase